MFNNIKTTVQRLANLSWPDFRDIFSWPGGSTINAENPQLLVAKAASANGEPIVFVTAEPILLVTDYVTNPNCTPNEAVQAGDAIDAALAQQANVNRMWIVVPPEAPQQVGERRLRVVERKVYKQPAPQRQISYEIKHSVAYLN